MGEVCYALSRWMRPELFRSARKPPMRDLPFRIRSTALMPVEGHWLERGDIVSTPAMPWPFVVECKKQEGWELDGILQRQSWEPWKWWEQAKTQASAVCARRQVNLYPLLVFARNRRPPMVLLDGEAAWNLRLEVHILRYSPASGAPLAILSLSRLCGTPVRLVEELCALPRGSSPERR